MVGLWAVPVRPPTRVAGVIYRRVECISVPRLGTTTDERLDMQRHVSPAVGVSPRPNSLAFAPDNCNAGSGRAKAVLSTVSA